MLYAEKLLQEDFRKLFLALTLVRSKPLNISVKEFLRILRNNLKRGHLFDFSGSDQYIDAVAYWKDKYSALMDDHIALKNHISTLQRQKNAAEPDSSSEKNMLRVANTPTKRKRENLRNESKTDDTDRLKPITELSDEEGMLKHSCNAPTQISSSQVAEYLGHVYNLQWTLKQKISTPIDVGTIMVDLCVDLMGLVEYPTSPHPQKGKKDRSKVYKATKDSVRDGKSRYRLVKSGCSDLMNSLRLYTSIPRKIGVDGRVVYAFARLFATLLGKIQMHSHLSGIEVSKPAANQGRGRLKGRGISVQIGSPDEDPRSSLSHILVWISTQLDLSFPLQKDIMDACMYYLLSRVGMVLKRLVLEPELNHDSTTKDDNAISLRSEAPYLVWITERVLMAYRNFHLPPMSKLSRGLHPSLQKGAVSVVLSDAARSRLQKTMLKAVYDDDEVSFEDRLFEPKDSKFDFGQYVQPEAENIDEWFMSKIWTVLGWDVLQDYISFDES